MKKLQILLLIKILKYDIFLQLKYLQMIQIKFNNIFFLSNHKDKKIIKVLMIKLKITNIYKILIISRILIQIFKLLIKILPFPKLSLIKTID